MSKIDERLDDLTIEEELLRKELAFISKNKDFNPYNYDDQAQSNQEKQKKNKDEEQVYNKYDKQDQSVQLKKKTKSTSKNMKQSTQEQPTKIEPLPNKEEEHAKAKSHMKQAIKKAKENNTLDLCFLVDCTDSMKEYVMEVEKQIEAIIDQFEQKFKFKVRVAFVAYKDRDNKKIVEVHDFTSNLKQLKQFLQGIDLTEYNSDYAEDVIAGLRMVPKLKWESKVRLIVHIADYPCHGSGYHSMSTFLPLIRNDNFSSEDPTDELQQIFQSIRKLDIKNYFFMRITKYTDLMIEKFKKIYEKNGCNLSTVELGIDLKSLCSATVSVMAKTIS